ncbi:MAG TPA: YciI family protein [Candidatus Limnocylindria bacterium]|nr:YciI family protein [Candidatus Limnocylindria bacterium]
MGTPTTKSDYMLLFRGTDWDEGLSPEQLQQVMSNWGNWFQGLIDQGKVLSGHPLTNEGKIVSGKKGRTVADGPFAESKEAIGGYFYLQVLDLDEAVAIAQQCPGLDYGIQVEVRVVAERCAMMERAQEAAAQAQQLAGTPA